MFNYRHLFIFVCNPVAGKVQLCHLMGLLILVNGFSGPYLVATNDQFRIIFITGLVQASFFMAIFCKKMSQKWLGAQKALGTN
tara:strand:- start:239 stop:487 length:249 start_codon:yes stop_codon:yes gene_type:complete